MLEGKSEKIDRQADRCCAVEGRRQLRALCLRLVEQVGNFGRASAVKFQNPTPKMRIFARGALLSAILLTIPDKSPGLILEFCPRFEQ